MSIVTKIAQVVETPVVSIGLTQLELQGLVNLLGGGVSDQSLDVAHLRQLLEELKKYCSPTYPGFSRLATFK